MIDAFNPVGSTQHVNFTTTKTTRWETSAVKCHVNWAVCDSDWEAEFCHVVESNSHVRKYAKNQGLGLEVPYVLGAIPRRYFPDFIVQIDDGHTLINGQRDLLNLIVEIKGFRGEDAKEKANTMNAYWVPGVNNLKRFGRWQFLELTNGNSIKQDFDAAVEAYCNASRSDTTA